MKKLVGVRTRPPRARAGRSPPRLPPASRASGRARSRCSAPTAPRAIPRPVAFDLTQKGKVLTGTAGPPDRQWKVEEGAVNAGTATFEVQQPDGPLFRFTLTIVKGRLQGDMAGERRRRRAGPRQGRRRRKRK